MPDKEVMEIPDCQLGRVVANHMQARPLAKGCCESAVEAFEALRVATGAINWAFGRLGVMLDRIQKLERQLGIAKGEMTCSQLSRFKATVKKKNKP